MEKHVFYWNHLLSSLSMIFFGWILWIRYLKRGRKDKAKHFMISAGLTFIALTILSLLELPWWISMLAVMAVGLGKEVADKLNPKKKLFDWEDVLADFLGMMSIETIYIFSFMMIKYVEVSV